MRFKNILLTILSIVLLTAGLLRATNRGLIGHMVQVYDENGNAVTDITSVTVYLTGTTIATIYRDSALAHEVTQPMTTGSTNSTLVDGKFTWYGPDAFTVQVTSTKLGSAVFRELGANCHAVVMRHENVPMWRVLKVTNAQIKTLHGSPLELVPAPGPGYMIDPIEAILVLDYGSNVLTESADNLALALNSASPVAMGQAIEATGFITASADTVTNWAMSKDNIQPAADVVNKNLCLYNSGDGEYAGNAGNDTTLTISVLYRMVPVGL